MMAARFESDENRRPMRLFASRLQGVNFGMLTAGTDMPAFANDLVRSDDDAADAWIRGGRIQTALGKA